MGGSEPSYRPGVTPCNLWDLFRVDRGRHRKRPHGNGSTHTGLRRRRRCLNSAGNRSSSRFASAETIIMKAASAEFSRLEKAQAMPAASFPPPPTVSVAQSKFYKDNIYIKYIIKAEQLSPPKRRTVFGFLFLSILESGTAISRNFPLFFNALPRFDLAVKGMLDFLDLRYIIR